MFELMLKASILLNVAFLKHILMSFIETLYSSVFSALNFANYEVCFLMKRKKMKVSQLRHIFMHVSALACGV